jgi:hypothetical protein
MQVTIDKISDIKQGQRGGVSSKIHAGNDYWYVNEDGSHYVGQVVQFDEEHKQSAKGNKYRIAHNVKVVEQPTTQQYANGATQPWSEWEAMAARAHALAKVLEPDEFVFPPQGGSEDPERLVRVDRSMARMRFVNTVLIAFSNGKIAADEDEGPVPF